jgi:hypothetical protein
LIRVDGHVTTVTVSEMAELVWVALSYRLPREPSRLRLGVWRRLKRFGAIVLHDAVWLLPADAKTREAFEWLAEEIQEQGGTALIWEAHSIQPLQDQEIIERFRTEADDRYALLAESARRLRRLATSRRVRLTQLQQARRQLLGLERAVRLDRRRDYFRAPGRTAAEEMVRQATADLDRVINAADTPGEGRARAVGH